MSESSQIELSPWKQWQTDNPFNVKLSWRECGHASSGHSLFECVSEAMTPLVMDDAKTVRNKAAEKISSWEESEFVKIMNEYRERKKENKFVGSWNPNEVKTKEAFKTIFVKPNTDADFVVDGDEVAIRLICAAYDINLYVFHSTEETLLLDNHTLGAFSIFLMLQMAPKKGKHYLCLGQETGEGQDRIQTIFESDKLPVSVTAYLEGKKKSDEEKQAVQAAAKPAQEQKESESEVTETTEEQEEPVDTSEPAEQAEEQQAEGADTEETQEEQVEEEQASAEGEEEEQAPAEEEEEEGEEQQASQEDLFSRHRKRNHE